MEESTNIAIDAIEHGHLTIYFYRTTLWWTNSLQLNMAIEIVDFPIKNGGSFHGYVSSPEGNIAIEHGHLTYIFL